MLKRFVPFAHARSIFEIELGFYKRLGIKYIFSDLDNTLDSYKQKSPSKRVFELKEKLNKEEIELIIVSNNKGKRVSRYANELGVRYFSSLCKPFPSKLLKKIEELKISKDIVLMIGDQTVTDISCANGAKIKNVLTDKIVKEDQPTTYFNRLFDKPIRRKLSKKKLLKDWREI